MKPAERIKAEEFMNSDPLTAEKGEKISKVKTRMEENNLKAIPVVDSKNRLQGAVSYRKLIRHIQFNPQSASVEKVMHQPPEFDYKDSLVELSELRIDSGEKMLVKTKDKKLEGVVSDQEFLDAFEEVEELDEIETDLLESRDVITVKEDESIEKARHRMLDNNISRLPVVDSNGELSGILRSTEILKTIVPREGQGAGGTSGGRSGSDSKMAGGNEKQGATDIPVTEIMNRNVSAVLQNMKASKAVDKLRQSEGFDVLRTNQDRPEAILTVKDFVKFLADLSQKNMVLVSVTGLDVDEEKAAVHRKIRKQLQGSLGRKLQQPEELRLRVKKSESDGKKHRYELELKLHSDQGVTNIEEDGWELLDVLDEALNELNTVVRKRVERDKEHR
ncbi:MAG: CBS domain-containing protein [Candidatus Nanohaloarchaea archaeon]